MRKTPTYTTWQSMIARCKYPYVNGYKNYGGRGITVCDRWTKPGGFLNFLADMGERPEGKSIDRINNDGNYEPSNCRWATPQEQTVTQRKRHRMTDEDRKARDAARQRARRRRLDPLVGTKRPGPERKKECSKGHPYTAENTYVTPAGERQCRACNASRARARRERKG